MDKRLRNRTILLLIGAAILAFALVRLSGRQPVAKISAMIPGKQNIVSSVTSNGKVEPISPYSIRAQLDTFVEKVGASEGQNVKKGQMILELNVRDVSSQLAAAKSRLLRAEDDLRTSQSGGRPDEAARVNGDMQKALANRDRFKRQQDSLQKLFAQGAATKDEIGANALQLTNAESELRRLTAVKQEFDRHVQLDKSGAALAVQQAQNDVAALDSKVRQGRILAPLDGTLYNLPVKPGDYVKMGDLLAEMADLHQVRVRAFIDEPEIGTLEPGQPVKITWDALPSRSWTGKTEIIPKQVVARGSRSVGELLCSVENDKLELLPNTNVTVRIHSRERLNVLAVPRGAVESEGGQRYVFVVKDQIGKSVVEKRAIQVGIADATNYEVVSGLNQGEVVALPGDTDLKDGLAVRVVNMDTSNLRSVKDADL